jgi:hypothetical protein
MRIFTEEQEDGANWKLCGWIHGRLDPSLAELDRAVAKEAEQRPAARCLMEQPGVGSRRRQELWRYSTSTLMAIKSGLHIEQAFPIFRNLSG